jgi:hypothetical protein
MLFSLQNSLFRNFIFTNLRFFFPSLQVLEAELILNYFNHFKENSMVISAKYFD